MLDICLLNVTLPTGGHTDVCIKRGIVQHVGSAGRAHEVMDCTGWICLPGAIDMHVHMRDGFQAFKETWKTGSMSAIAGGITLVVDQPNTDPPLLSPERYRGRVEEARHGSYCHYAINGGIALEADVEALWRGGAMAFGEIFTSPSSYGEPVPYHHLAGMLHTIGSLGAVATLHAEEIPARVAYHLEEHDILRSPEGEAHMVRKVEKSVGGVRLHFCHLSSPLSLAATTSTFEVSPHHLLLSLNNFDRNDARGKVNPPLRKEHVRRALLSQWDRIPVIASDHAPHTLTEKQSPFENAPAGLPGVETMIPLLLSLVLKGKITLSSLVEKTSITPAKILKIPPAGFTKGCRADFALYRPIETTISADQLHSRCGWTPYEGMKGVFPECVIMDGARIYDCGDFMERRGRWFPGRGYIPSRSMEDGADTAHS